jgi:hypothetical protein
MLAGMAKQPKRGLKLCPVFNIGSPGAHSRPSLRYSLPY